MGRIVFNLVIVALTVVCLEQARQKAGLPLEVSRVDGVLVIDRFHADAPPALTSRARVGEPLLQLDARPIDNEVVLETDLDSRRVGDTVTVTVATRSGIGAVPIVLKRYYSTLYLSISAIVATLFLALGILVALKRPGDRASMIFHLAMGTVAPMIATSGRYSMEPYGIGIAAHVGYLACYAFMTVLFFHFTLYFPATKWRRVRGGIGLLYGVATVVALYTGSTFVLATSGSDAWMREHAVAYQLCQSFFALLGIAGVGSIVHSYRSAVEESERKKLRWVLTGVTVGFLTFIVADLIPGLFGRLPLIAEHWTVLLTGVAPVTFTVAIVRHRVMDIDLILSRSTVYTIVLAGVVAIHVSVMVFLQRIVQLPLGSPGDLAPILTAVIVAILFEPVRVRVQRFVDRRFFRARYNLREAQRRLADELSVCADTSTLTSTATSIVDGILAPERIALATVHGGGRRIERLAGDARVPAEAANSAAVAAGAAPHVDRDARASAAGASDAPVVAVDATHPEGDARASADKANSATVATDVATHLAFNARVSADDASDTAVVTVDATPVEGDARVSADGASDVTVVSDDAPHIVSNARMSAAGAIDVTVAAANAPRLVGDARMSADRANQATVVADDAPHIVAGELYAIERWIEPGVEHSTDAQALLERLGVCCAVTASIDGDDIAMLVVGPKKSGTRYTLEDLDVLRAAITHTSSGLERIMLQRNVLRREAEAEQLRVLNQMKSYFVSSVTHELKTPLTSIRMFAEMLQADRTVEVERVRRYARIIESESQRLSRLIDNVLDFSKIERGVKDYRFVRAQLGDIVDGVISSLEHQIASAGCTLDRRDEAGAIHVRADPDAIAGAIVNLISNAIKYSPEDRRITLATFRRGAFAGVSVTDHGIGLSDVDRAHIFDPFFRTEAGKNTGAAGTGLGLALVRHVVDAHNGAVDVDSTPGVGSTFTLLLPISNDHEIHPTD